MRALKTTRRRGWAPRQRKMNSISMSLTALKVARFYGQFKAAVAVFNTEEGNSDDILHDAI